jgi:DNA-binding MarR family transcriptional regulator
MQGTGVGETDRIRASTGDDEVGLRLEAFLPYRLSVLTNKISASLAAIYRERFGITIPEWRVLANLGRFGPMSAVEVAARGSMDKVRVSRTIAKMRESGLVTRRTDPADNRASILALSADGKRMFNRIAPMALAWEAEFLAPFDSAELATLDDLMRRLNERIDSYNHAGEASPAEP